MLDKVKFEAFLRQHDDKTWRDIVKNLLLDIHPVDIQATQIWFSFFPYKLIEELENAADSTVLAKELLLRGKYKLIDQIDTSHEFLYGHKYWPQVKEVVIADVKNPPRTTLEMHIRQAAGTLNLDTSLVLGITAVAYMTLQQVGLNAFCQPIKSVLMPTQKSPEEVLKERAKKEKGKLFSFLNTIDKPFTVCFNENIQNAKFKVINMETLTMAATKIKDDYKATDLRCVEGPIPIECQTGACGSCWVGILGGNENVGEITPFEIGRLKKIGYPYHGESNPLIRLACKTTCQGPVSIVIPPWNGVIAPLYEKTKTELQDKKETEELKVVEVIN